MEDFKTYFKIMKNGQAIGKGSTKSEKYKGSDGWRELSDGPVYSMYRDITDQDIRNDQFNSVLEKAPVTVDIPIGKFGDLFEMACNPGKPEFSDLSAEFVSTMMVDGEDKQYYKVILSGVNIIGASIRGYGGNVPRASFTLSYNIMEMETNTIDDKGTIGSQAAHTKIDFGKSKVEE